MSIADNHQKTSELFKSKTGIDLINIEQGTDEWRTVKLGVISASNADKVVAGKNTQKRAGYMCELIAEIATGLPPEFYAKAMEWGKQYEQAARSAYEFHHDVSIKEVSFLFKDESFRVGCSPDGITDKGRGLEIKCPCTSKVFIENLFGKMKPEYEKQVQYSMWVTGLEEWEFINFDPRMKKNMLHVQTIERKEKMMKEFDEKVYEFIDEMNQKMQSLGIGFGEQWES